MDPSSSGISFTSIYIGLESKTNVIITAKLKDHKTVNMFYNAAISAGGVDHGKPGLRPQYHPNYYSTFKKDP
ncbi:hypothetical protein ASPZODRAFT_137289 [Penicilliopsis zonata CBS 506.65]|uniref:Uncharacterized protein n=1 Tax=Penicilliopsis zonata CBS 506.65 TaxID=1073090 RepID=A0A1L9S5S6_9EURO|nr:hypothetical protein ASPZODRAFT_137289 [Penicilliopsis zonata CBS 506.65]OJJ42493.1 hypothetical protein ASPZODRAFT_137289 [Penicilliopsis zonata CBS 506.65]